MKKWVLMGMIAAAVLSGCGKHEKIGTAAETAETTAGAVKETAGAAKEAETAAEATEEPKSDFELHFNEVTIDGQQFSVPISYQELEAMGFHLDSSQKEEVIEGTPVTGYSSFGDEQKGSFGMDFRFKGSGPNKPLEECDAVTFLWDVDAAGGAEVSFYGGKINSSSTREEVAALLDEVYADENGAQYTKAADEKGYSELSVYFDKDQLVMVELYNYADYVAE